MQHLSFSVYLSFLFSVYHPEKKSELEAQKYGQSLNSLNDIWFPVPSAGVLWR